MEMMGALRFDELSLRNSRLVGLVYCDLRWRVDGEVSKLDPGGSTLALGLFDAAEPSLDLFEGGGVTSSLMALS